MLGARQVKEMELHKIYVRVTVTPEEHGEPAFKMPHNDQSDTSQDSVFEEFADVSASESRTPTTATI